VALLAVAAAGGVATPASYAEGDERDEGDERQHHRVFRINSPEITESSSLFVSTAHPGLVYTTNDSGDAPTVYVLDAASGALVGRATLAGVDTVDVEALAGGPDGKLVLADIGDNDAERVGVSAYRLAQPGAGDRTVSAELVELSYVDGPRDAESALYDARSGRLYVVSKEFAGASVYATPRHVFDRTRAVLRRIAGAPAIATDATLLPASREAVVRTYTSASVYRFPSFERLSTVPLPPTEQGESIAAPPSGDVVWVGSEGLRSPVIAVRLPKPLPTVPPSTPPTTPTTTAPGDAGATGTGEPLRGVAEKILAATAVGVVVLVAVGIGLAWRRRSG